MTAVLRPLTTGDVPAIDRVAAAAFQEDERAPAETELLHRRLAHVIETDPGGAIGAETGGELIGVALAIVREGVWGLSLLVVLPEQQGRGLGRQLLDATLEYAGGTRGQIIDSSDDPGALRRYAAAGFRAEPYLGPSGTIRAPLRRPGEVRDGDAGDLPWIAEIDRTLRGAAHDPDWAFLLGAGVRLLVLEGRGYAFVNASRVYALGARTPDDAATLLRAALAELPADREPHIPHVTARQSDWAIPVLLDAGLALRPMGALFFRGELGTLAPYLPSGAFL